ncbi:MAG: P-II family nitrogen regulator [Mariprofundus sp.]|nr:P-II family nitrogen regulator [Mariprofundus sp.]
MEYRKVNAIINTLMLEKVDTALRDIQVPGMTVTQVKGYGEYHDFYQPDMMCKHANIEIFCKASEADAIAACIMDAAHTGQSGDGIVAITPVERIYCIRTKSAQSLLGINAAEPLE